VSSVAASWRLPSWRLPWRRAHRSRRGDVHARSAAEGSVFLAGVLMCTPRLASLCFSDSRSTSAIARFALKNQDQLAACARWFLSAGAPSARERAPPGAAGRPRPDVDCFVILGQL
jgi:hypothetical protein